MKNEYRMIKAWAVNKVADQKLRKEIIKDVETAFTNNTKAKAWLEFLYKQGEHENLPNAVKAITVKGRTRTEETQSCWACGTPHNDTYHCEYQGAEVFIGNVCAKTKLARYGLNSGVLTTADKKSAMEKRDSVQSELENLVIEGEGTAFTFVNPAPAGRNESYIGTQVDWVLKQEDAPKDVKAAAQKIKDSFSRPGRKTIQLVLEYVEKNREFPSDVYAPAARDIELMEQEGNAPAGLAKKLLSAKQLTGEKARALCSQAGVDYLKFRIERNSGAIRRYETQKSLGALLDEILPVIEHDKPLWRDDLAVQLYRFNKVLSPSDYKLVRRCLKRWAFGSTERLGRIDRLKLRNIAVRLEPVADFNDVLEGIVTIGRKLQYAKDHVNSAEQKALEGITREIAMLPDKQKSAQFRKLADSVAEQVKDPCRLLKKQCMSVEAYNLAYGDGLQELVTKVDRSYAPGDRIWENNYSKVAGIKDRIQYGIITKDDVRVLQVLNRRVNTFMSIKDMYIKKEVREVQEALNSRLVAAAPFDKYKDAFKNADCFGNYAVRMMFKIGLHDGKNWAPISVTRIAAQDYDALRKALSESKLTEDKVLEMRAQLKGVPDDQILSGRSLKYICPVKVKQLYDKLR